MVDFDGDEENRVEKLCSELEKLGQRYFLNPELPPDVESKVFFDLALV
jgi:hypothetical protein